MNLFKIYFLAIVSLVIISTSCSIDEDLRFNAPATTLKDLSGANAVLNGVYSKVDQSYNNGYTQAVMASSGLFGINTLPFSQTIGSLAPLASNSLVEDFWSASFRAIASANDLISNLSKIDLPDIEERNNILGQSYFIRSLIYFNLVRVYGAIPLLTVPASLEKINLPRKSVEQVYQQIIADADTAKVLMKPKASQNLGRPGKEAAGMLLAKVYMTLAGNTPYPQTAYWQKAWDEAIQLYGKYSLVPKFSLLWYDATGDNTPESIFEIQGNATNGSASRWERIFSAPNSNAGRNMYGRIWANLEVYDAHAKRYPGDPRIGFTFTTSYAIFNAAGNQNIQGTYPSFKTRGNVGRSYPWLFKYFIKNIEKLDYTNNKNILVFRYADLLLMLAEIENEINGPENAYKYINEVLARARNSVESGTSITPANWTGMSQKDFRSAIMKEYQFELLGEGQEWFSTRRRGYSYFKTNVIDAHNNHPSYNFTISYDNKYPDNERIMLLPIPSSELSSNSSMSVSDQNPGTNKLKNF